MTDPRPSRGGMGPSPTRELSLDPSQKFQVDSDSIPTADLQRYVPALRSILVFSDPVEGS